MRAQTTLDLSGIRARVHGVTRTARPFAVGRRVGRLGATALLVLAIAVAAAPATAQVADELVAAADRGEAEAQYRIGKLYERGEGVDADDFTAVRWFQRAAEGGHGRAALDLGWMISNGYGATRDLERAFFWFVVAKLRGATDAEIQIAALADDIPATARAEIEARARSEAGDASAPPIQDAETDQDTLQTVRLDDPISLRRRFWNPWPPDYLNRLEALAQRGDLLSQNLLGLALVRRTDLNRRRIGRTWLYQAARAGFPAAQYNLATLFLDPGQGAPDPEAAERWLLRVRDAHSAPASQSYEEATRLFREAGEYDDRYRAAALGYESAADALDELVRLRLQEARSLQELARRRRQ